MLQSNKTGQAWISNVRGPTESVAADPYVSLIAAWVGWASACNGRQLERAELRAVLPRGVQAPNHTWSGDLRRVHASILAARGMTAVAEVRLGSHTSTGVISAVSGHGQHYEQTCGIKTLGTRVHTVGRGGHNFHHRALPEGEPQPVSVISSSHPTPWSCAFGRELLMARTWIGALVKPLTWQ